METTSTIVKLPQSDGKVVEHHICTKIQQATVFD